MRTVLELLRILALLVIFGAVAAVLTESLYTVNESVAAYAWISGFALLLLFFVAYRNALQFSGWYKGEQRKKVTEKGHCSTRFHCDSFIACPICFRYCFSLVNG